MKTAETKTGSKLILLGEHLVVHGFSGIAVPFEVVNSIKITKSDSWQIITESEALKNQKFETALKTLVSAFTTEPLQIEIQPHAFPGSGLGMSASLGVGLVKGLDTLYPGKTELERLGCCEQWEKNWHHTPSGIDVMTLWHEKPIKFKHTDITTLDLNLDWFWSELQVYHTGRPQESTREMIDVFARAFDPDQDLIDHTAALLLAIEQKDQQALIDIFNTAGHFLETMGMVSASVIEISRALRAQGCGVKISGAGGQKAGSGVLLVIGEFSGLEQLRANRVFAA